MRTKWISSIVASLIPLAPTNAAVLVEQRSPVFNLPTGEVVEDSIAVFKRREDSVELEFISQSLPAGVHTLWLDFYPEPALCTGTPCNENDFFDPNIPVNELWVEGAIVGEDGKVNYSVMLEEGSSPGEITIGRGLEAGDALNAEYQFITRWHGSPSQDPQILEEQLTTFNGGCSVEEGDGLFECQDLQLVAFPVESIDQSVPEPSSLLGLLTLGWLGITFVRQRQKNKLIKCMAKT